VVTGANAGLGRATALGLARLGARVVLACRDAGRGERARAEIAAESGQAALEVMVVDLARPASIRGFARDLAARHPRLDVLVNNAGVWQSRRTETPEGLETTWATNVLGYFLLTELLKPALQAAGRARVVNVASEFAGGLDLGDVGFERRPFDGRAAYQQSKQADRMLTWAQARRLAGTGVTANAMHPGFVATEIFRKGGGLLGWAVSAYARWKARPPAQGADTIVWLAASPEVAGRTGGFFVNRRERDCRFRGESGEEALWALCAGQVAAP
jgi:retinol dehydrogenase-12/retinol dehydrogenase-13